MSKKLTAIAIKSQNIEDMADTLASLIEENDTKWTKGWSTVNRKYRNYVSNKEYNGGSNIFTLWLSTLFMPKILDTERSCYYITAKQAQNLKWHLKDEVKNWSKDNEERRKQIDKIYEEAEKLDKKEDKERLDELKTQIRELRTEIYKHEIWHTIIYFEFTLFKIVLRVVEGEEKYIRQNLEYDKNTKEYNVLNEHEVSKEYVDKNLYQLDKVTRSISTRYYMVAPIEFFEGKKKLKGRKTEATIYATKKTNRDAWKTLNDYFKRENIKVFDTQTSNEAYYNPTDDTITLPKISQFEDELEAIATASHEAGHSTGHKSRLDRHFDDIKSQTLSEYSKEELVAEMTSMFFLKEQEILDEKRLDKTLSYLKGYLQLIKENDEKNNLIYGINNAYKAYEYIANIETATTVECE